MSTDRGIHVAQDRSRSRTDAGRQSIQRWCDIGHEALAAQEWATLHAICDAELLPCIETAPRVLRATARLAEEADRPFDGQALRQYAQHCDGTAHVAVNPGVDADETTLQNVESGVTSVPVSEAVLTAAFRSIYTLLAVAGRVDTQAETAVPAVEYEHQVGERYYRALSPGSRRAELIDRDGDLELLDCDPPNEYGDGYVRLALVENEQRTRQAIRSIKAFMRKADPDETPTPASARSSQEVA